MKAILSYHSVDPSGSVVSVHPERFREHLDVLRERHVPVLSVEELVAPHCAEGVAITFDDGFENLATVAWPLLRERGFAATVFVATDWVGRENGWDPGDGRIPRLPLMSWSTLAELADDGLRLASHTRTHARLTALGDAELADELEGSREAIRTATGVDARELAYPYGDHDGRVLRVAEASGYALGVTTELRFLDAIERAPLRLPRLDGYYLAKPGVMERWGTPGLRRYVRFRHAGRRVRGSLEQAGLLP